jgi:hypothetical protein
VTGKKSRLTKARDTRSANAEVFDAVSNHRISVRELLEDPPDTLRRTRVYDVLRRLPHLSRGGAETVLLKAKVWPLTPMDELTEEEREQILLLLPPRVPR